MSSNWKSHGTCTRSNILDFSHIYFFDVTLLEESEWQEAKCPEKDKHKKRKNKHSRDKKTKNTLEDVKTQICPSYALKSNVSDHSLSSDIPVKDDNQLPDEGGNLTAQGKKQKFKLVRQKLSIVE